MLYMSFAPSTLTFIMSVFYGILFGVLWDLFRIFRKNLNKFKHLVFFLDVTYFVLVSISTIYFFFTFTSGGFRFFVIVGEILGFLLFYSTIERFVYSVLNWFISLALLLTRLVYRILLKLFLKLTSFLEKNILKTFREIKRFDLKEKIKNFKIKRNLKD